MKQLRRVGWYLGVSYLLVCAALPGRATARLLQIIHTNDLHSHLEKGSSPGFGGYAAVKTIMDRLKFEAAVQGIDTLALDAGDFSEGSQFYLADRGQKVWEVLDAMGYDAITIGNHDWLMGPKDLDRIVGNVKPSFAFLGANFIFDGRWANLGKYMKPWAEYQKAGAKIAVLGLTTDQFLYTWRAEDGFVHTPQLEAREDIKKLKARGADFIIALTHLGVSGDKSLVANTRGIDLVVGGHSHTTLREPVYQKDLKGQPIPIVQASDHGHFVGDLLVDVEPGRPIQILRYQLIPVNSEDTPKDPTIVSLVKEARDRLEKDYGREWLYEVIGHSEVALERPTNGPTIWGDIVESAIMEAAGADLSINNHALYGPNQQAGPVTRETIFEFYPRMFDFDNKYGWEIWTTNVRGYFLKKTVEKVNERGHLLNVAGLTYDLYYKNGKRKLRNFKVNGKSMKWWKNYKVAFPEGVARGAVQIHDALKLIFRDAKTTRIPIWFAIENKVREIGTIKATGTMSLESHEHDHGH